MTNTDDGPGDADAPQHEGNDRTGEELGPKSTSDHATMADMGLGGPPAESATTTGQGEEDVVGASPPAQETDRA